MLNVVYMRALDDDIKEDILKGITSNVITYKGFRRLHKKKIFSRNNVDNISRLNIKMETLNVITYDC
jgi:hypothetical protein